MPCCKSMGLIRRNAKFRAAIGSIIHFLQYPTSQASEQLTCKRQCYSLVAREAALSEGRHVSSCAYPCVNQLEYARVSKQQAKECRRTKQPCCVRDAASLACTCPLGGWKVCAQRCFDLGVLLCIKMPGPVVRVEFWKRLHHQTL